MDTQQFERAAERSKQFTKRPTNEELLQLYALYKQATEGDDAWDELKGKSKEQAMQDYVALVDKLEKLYA